MRCQLCEEKEAIVKVSVTTVQGELLDSEALCRNCAKEWSVGVNNLAAAGRKHREVKTDLAQKREAYAKEGRCFDCEHSGDIFRQCCDVHCEAGCCRVLGPGLKGMHDGPCCPGYLHMNEEEEEGERICDIQRCDECGRFETDEEACEAHDKQCRDCRELTAAEVEDRTTADCFVTADAIATARIRITPACALSMGCLCAGHASGRVGALDHCDTRESP